MENYKELLTALYKEHAPEKIEQIDFYLNRYKGKEKQFYITQKAKYSNKKSITDSKKILEEAMSRIKNKGKETEIKQPDDILAEKAKEKEAQKAKEKVLEKKAIKETPKVVPKTEITKEEKKTEIEEAKSKKEIIVADTKKEEVSKAEINPPIKKPAASKGMSEEKILSEKKEIIEEKPLKKAENEKEKIAPVKTTEDNKDLKDLSKEEEARKQENNAWKLEKERFERSKANYKKKEKKRTPLLWYLIGIVAIFLLLVVAVWFFYYSDFDKKQDEPVNVQKVKVETKEVSTNKSENKGNNPTIVKDESKVAAPPKKETTPPKEEKKEAKKESSKKTDTKETPPTKEPKKTKKPAQTKPSADRIYSKDINKPAIFVGCFATKTESQAQKKITILKQYGLDAHYYWIPDLEPKGNPYFKVVAGPFNSVTDAYPSLTKAQERVNFDSYILIVK